MRDDVNRQLLKQYRNIDTFREALEAFEQRFGRVKTLDDLRNAEGQLIFAAIGRFHGSLEAVRKRICYEAQASAGSDYWKEWRHVSVALKLVCYDICYLRGKITSGQLVKLDKVGVLEAVKKYHGGLKAAQRRVKGEYWRGLRTSSKTWVSEERLDDDLLAIVRARGCFPTNLEFGATDLSDMHRAIAKYHGGLTAVKLRLGYMIPKRSPHFWDDWKNVEAAVKEIIFCLGGRFPMMADFFDFGHPTLPAMIARHHGGLRAIRLRMGYGPITDALLKKHADQLVEVFLALTVEKSALRSDALWTAIKDRWTGAQLEEALAQFARGNLDPFKQLLIT